MSFTNKTMGNVLKSFLIVGVIISGLLVVTTFFYSYAFHIYEQIIIIDQALTVLNQIVWILLIIFYLIWIFKVHADLRRLNPSYGISAGGALARLMIPFYNLYGMWNVYSTMGKYFTMYSALEALGRKLIGLVPVYYFLYWGTRAMERLIAKGVILNDTFIFVYYALDLILMVSMLLITKTVLNAFRIIEADQEKYVKKEEELPKWAIE